MTDFYSRDSDRAFEEIKAELYARLQDVKENILEYDADDPDFEETYAEGYYDRLIAESMFLVGILDKFERS